MRLVSKLTLLLMVGICAVLAIDGYLSVQRELDLFDHDMTTDAQLFGRALALTTAQVLATQGEEKAREVLAQASSASDRLQIRLVWLDVEPKVSVERRRALAAGETVSATTEDGPQGHLHTHVPLTAGGRSGAIEIRESLRAKHDYTRKTIKRIVLVVAATVLVCAAVALLLGAWLVGRPMSRLVNRARAIGAGELEERLSLRRRDEIGVLAGEIDSMTIGLLAARQRIERETADRLSAEQQLRHADRLATVGTLAAGIAHELGSPLNIVAERATMIQRQQVTGEAALDNARIIREQSERMTAIVRQLMDFARRRTTEVRRCDLAQLARKTIALLDKMAMNRSIELELREEAEAPLESIVDRDQLEQALTNLIINAVQASPTGSVVTVATRRSLARRPGAGASAEQPCVELRVSDRGAGIPTEHLEHVFEPFYTTKDVGEGTGLGLAVTHGIVSDHGGWIEVESEVGEGTCFRILLPEGETA